MKVYMTTIDCCNDCPFCDHREMSETWCSHTTKIVHSQSIDAECPLPDFEMINEGDNATIETD